LHEGRLLPTLVATNSWVLCMHAIEYAWPHGHLDPSFLPVVPSGLSVRDFARVVHDLHHLDPATTVQVLSSQPPHCKLPGAHMLHPGDAVQVRRRYKPRPGADPGTNGAGDALAPVTVPAFASATASASLPLPPPVPPPKLFTAFVVVQGMDSGWYADLAQATLAGSLALPACRVKAAEPFLAGATSVDLADECTARLVRRAVVCLPGVGPSAVTATAVGSVAAWAVRAPPPGPPFAPTTIIHVTTLDGLADALPPGARLCTDHLPWLHSDMALPSRADAPLGQWLLAKDPAVLRLRRACTMARRVALRCAQAMSKAAPCPVPCPVPAPVPGASKVLLARQGYRDGAHQQDDHQQKQDPRGGPQSQRVPGGGGGGGGGPRRRRRG